MSSLTVTANLEVVDADVGKDGNIYLVACINGLWFAHDGAAWVRWSGGCAIPVYSYGTLTSRGIEVVRDLDTPGWVVTQVYLGYGVTEADMWVNGKFGQVCAFLEPIAAVRSS